MAQLQIGRVSSETVPSMPSTIPSTSISSPVADTAIAIAASTTSSVTLATFPAHAVELVVQIAPQS